MATALPSCPICMLPIPANELERHANGHFEDYEFERDMELARQLSFAPPSPHSYNDQMHTTVKYCAEKNPENGAASTSQTNSGCDAERRIDEKINYILSSQRKAPFYKVEKGGLMNLLKNCLESETGNSISILSGYVDHFQSIKSEDIGWGCGWRNIQMASSYLLNQVPKAKEVLFGGCGFVPEIEALQRWLETAWERGFDAVGSSHFGGRVYGSNKWIGTTECAALFRSFGLRAKIVDFDGKDVDKNYATAYGPMDKFLSRKRNMKEVAAEGFCHDSERKTRGYQVLIDWVWRYFSDSNRQSFRNGCVMVTDKMPLYFQHQGHSRTILGIQLRQLPYGVKQYYLLILDPAHSTLDLETTLRKKFGWQKLLKRGIHTLKKAQYQLCYVDSGIATEEELEQLKTIDSVLFEF